MTDFEIIHQTQYYTLAVHMICVVTYQIDEIERGKQQTDRHKWLIEPYSVVDKVVTISANTKASGCVWKKLLFVGI